MSPWLISPRLPWFLARRFCCKIATYRQIYQPWAGFIGFFEFQLAAVANDRNVGQLCRHTRQIYLLKRVAHRFNQFLQRECCYSSLHPLFVGFYGEYPAEHPFSGHFFLRWWRIWFRRRQLWKGWVWVLCIALLQYFRFWGCDTMGLLVSRELCWVEAMSLKKDHSPASFSAWTVKN